MSHNVKPSIDLEGGSRQPIARRASKLSIRTATTRSVSEEPSLSPRSPASAHSEGTSSTRQSPLLDVPGTGLGGSSRNYFSTLPPSPTGQAFPPSPPLPAGLFTKSNKHVSAGETGYPTPPISHPGSAHLGNQFDLGTSSVTVTVDGNHNDNAGNIYMQDSRTWSALEQARALEMLTESSIVQLIRNASNGGHRSS